MSVIVHLLTGLFTLWWLSVLLRGGGDLLPSILILMVPLFISNFYEAWKGRPKPRKPNSEPAAEGFDPDAAIARYLAAKQEEPRGPENLS